MPNRSRLASVRIDTPTAPPYWALLERELLRRQAEAIGEFYERYFDDRGYLACVPRWGGDDGPDDAAENMLNWTMLHTLGGDDEVLALYRRGWEGHLRQYTEAKTTVVPLARDGMYYREFPVCFDWFHHGEGLSPFFLEGLCDPRDPALVRRTRAYAEMYMGEPNYDRHHRLIPSMFNGSRGPLLRRATPVDWAGDPIEVAGRFRALHGEGSWEQMLEHFRDYGEVVGDHPLNLGATTLALDAYALTGEGAYRDWVIEYVDAWAERTRANGGIIPSNIGRDGQIGGAAGGRWYGGCYGWAFTVDLVPYTGEKAHRPACYSRAHYGFANALLLTGKRGYVDLWREMLERVNANARQVDGRTAYPRMHGDKGWYDYRPEKFDPGALELWYWTGDRSALELLPQRPRWTAFLDGDDRSYPVEALQAELASVRERMERVRSDPTTPDTRLSDDPNELNPATTETLTELMLGGLPTGRVGFPLHCRLRYFDPQRRRAGVPEGVAVLVDGLTDDGVTATFVNVDPVATRTVVVQGGAYGEHRIGSVEVGGVRTAVDGIAFALELAPGAGGRLTIRMQRYAERPTMAAPYS
jgi:hypothetical protein